MLSNGDQNTYLHPEPTQNSQKVWLVLGLDRWMGVNIRSGNIGSVSIQITGILESELIISLNKQILMS